MSRNIEQKPEKLFSSELASLNNDAEAKLIITEFKDKICAFLIAEGKLKAATVILENEINPGDIIIASIKDIKNDIGACFIEYSENCYGYLPLNKIPKDITIKQGDLIPVILTAPEAKGKRAKFSAKIDYSKYDDCEELKKKANHLGRFNYLYRSESDLFSYLDRVFRKDEYKEIITDINNIYDKLSESDISIRLYEDKTFSLTKLYSLETKADEALNRKVWLKCGGYLVIDHTEAMTVIDVNSGKFTPSKGTDKETTYYTVNEEAAEEVCRQIRLRNISGIIIVDFINLSDENDKQSLTDILKDLSSKDIVQVNVIDITALGLVEITRKKELPPFYEQIMK